MADSGTVDYLKKSMSGGGKSSVVKGGQGRILVGGIKDGDRNVGTKRFDLGGKSMTKGRKM